MTESGRVLGLDLGDARIGVAISDAQRSLALPFGTVKAGAPEDMKALSAIVEENTVTEVVIGHPISLSGDEGPRAKKASAFAQALRATLSVPVILQDERFSTVEAERALATAGVKRRQRRARVDASAAAVILQSFLDASR